MQASGPPSTNAIAPRHWVGLAGVLLLALWVRACLLPAFGRHGWEGHEAEYLAVFRGDWQGGWSTRVVPLLGWIYTGLGTLTQAPEALLVLALVAGLASIFNLMLLVHRQVGPGAALLAGGLVALCGNHAFWSSSAYNVMLPHALLVAGLAVLIRGGWGALLGSGVLLGAAAAGRVELLVFCLPAALLLRGRGWLERIAWVAIIAMVFGLCALPMATQGAHPQGLWEQLPDALRINLLLPVFLQPFTAWPALLLASLFAAVATWRCPRPASFWLTVLVLGQTSGAAFADSGFRQALTPVVALCVLQALGVQALWRLGAQRSGAARWLPQAAAVLGMGVLVSLLALDSVDVAQRYYAPAPGLIAELEAASSNTFDASQDPDCQEINTSPARADGELGPFEVRHWDRCWLWVEDFQHRRWTSLGVHDRSRRMHHSFELTPLGMQRDPMDPGQPPRQVWRVVAPR